MITFGTHLVFAVNGSVVEARPNPKVRLLEYGTCASARIVGDSYGGCRPAKPCKGCPSSGRTASTDLTMELIGALVSLVNAWVPAFARFTRKMDME
jgi:hypothetical protein